MKRKSVISFVLLSVLLVSLVAAVGQSLAATNHNTDNKIVNSGTGSMAYLNLPPSTVTPTLPWHPSNIQLRCYHFDDTPMGPYDGILVYLWIPQRNSYAPAAFITNAPDAQLYEDVWWKTFIWYNTTASEASNMLNVIQVSSNDFSVVLQDASNGNGVKGGVNGQNGNLLTVSLKTPVNIHLPFNLWTAPYNTYGDLSFTLAPLTLKFRDIGVSYYDAGANAALPSLYYRQPISEMRTPAWVEESIPSWLGAVSPLEVCGHIDYHYTETITPPQ
jgi:hypothetical protein